MQRRLGLALILISVIVWNGSVAAPNGAQALSGGRAQDAPTSPPARYGAGMASDAAAQTVVLFGGSSGGPSVDGTPFFNDTWTWDGAAWTQQHPAASPPARVYASMASDAARSAVVLFGGNATTEPLGPSLDDTWTWDGTAWARQQPELSPPARATASMAYDAARGVVVLFGGGPDTGPAFADTWTWDGATWTLQQPAVSPPARYGPSMAYGAATGTIVLFGGVGADAYLNDTWTWDGSNWTQQQPAASPPPRSDAVMAPDAAAGTLLLFGGVAPSGMRPPTLFLSDTWTWDGSTWTQQQPVTSPPGRANAGMAYDAAAGVIVLFGGDGDVNDAGHNIYNDTWLWDGATWRELTP